MTNIMKGQRVAAKDNSNTNGASVTAKDNSDTNKNYKDLSDMVNSIISASAGNTENNPATNVNTLLEQGGENQTQAQEHKKEPMCEADMQVEDVSMFKAYQKLGVGNIALVSKAFENMSLDDASGLIYDILTKKNIMGLLLEKAQESAGELNQEEEDAHVQLLEQIDVVTSILQGAIEEMHVLQEKKEEYQTMIARKFKIEEATTPSEMDEAFKEANEELKKSYGDYLEGLNKKQHEDFDNWMKRDSEKEEALKKLEEVKATHPYNQDDVDTAQATFDQKKQEAQEAWDKWDTSWSQYYDLWEDWEFGWLKTI